MQQGRAGRHKGKSSQVGSSDQTGRHAGQKNAGRRKEIGRQCRAGSQAEESRQAGRHGRSGRQVGMADQAGRHAGTHYVQFRQDGQGRVGRAGREG
jgi:hypothetical protein